ncbi:hypothetical protein HMPREF4655_21434 [Helicobacter pylori 35A]|nr:hypothetical protein HMPREF4655_21434 [Helicobacter pylori 35A]
MRSFSPFNPTKSPYKEVLFKNYRWSFPLTKRLKRVFHQTLPKKKEF